MSRIVLVLELATLLAVALGVVVGMGIVALPWPGPDATRPVVIYGTVRP
jgi:hypothetical protein